jgi:uncharacterized damage-inducible protein DinB
MMDTLSFRVELEAARAARQAAASERIEGTTMITPDYARTMAAYNAEMNRRVYAAAERLPDAERRAERGAFWGSIHRTLSHLLWADQMWMSRFGVGGRPDARIADSGEYVEDFAELGAARREMDARIEAWAAALTPADLEGDLAWHSGAIGRDMVTPRALCVMHIFNHQTHHRGQVHALLTAAGEATGATDLPFVRAG